MASDGGDFAREFALLIEFILLMIWTRLSLSGIGGMLGSLPTLPPANAETGK